MKNKEKGIGKIAFPVKSLVECPDKNCADYGDYYKCYFDKMFLQCKIYILDNVNYSTQGEQSKDVSNNLLLQTSSFSKKIDVLPVAIKTGLERFLSKYPNWNERRLINNHGI